MALDFVAAGKLNQDETLMQSKWEYPSACNALFQAQVEEATHPLEGRGRSIIGSNPVNPK